MVHFGETQEITELKSVSLRLTRQNGFIKNCLKNSLFLKKILESSVTVLFLLEIEHYQLVSSFLFKSIARPKSQASVTRLRNKGGLNLENKLR